MAVFQSILNTYGKSKKTQEKEEKKLLNDIAEQPQIKKQFERVERAEKKLQDNKGGIDFKVPWSKYFIDKNEQEKAREQGQKYYAMTESDLKKQGRKKNEKTIESAYMPSSAIQKIRYNPKTKNLYIKFTSGDKEYLYPNVSSKDVQKYLTADSKGRYNYYKIRPKYAVSKEEALRIKQESKNK